MQLSVMERRRNRNTWGRVQGDVSDGTLLGLGCHGDNGSPTALFRLSLQSPALLMMKDRLIVLAWE